ncbi:MAG: DUF2206 domain-containing protein, partial [Methanobacteriaceae archaeon]|nr:DUF2206 domain-containing protein [Methanobacteriaceae archaeon]
MNDWGIKKFLKVVLAIQLAFWGAIGLDAIGIQIPIIRQLISFIYLIFIPGIIILRILKLHKLGNIETLLYTVGLSLATLMFTGFFINMIYPFFGISGPISTTPLIVTISAVVLILCVLCYIRDKDFSDPGFIDVKDVFSPPALFLCLIPLLAVFGTYLVNFHRNNTLLMLMIVVISAVVILIGFDKFIPKKLYPLAVLAISISLLFHNSLISMYIWGWDIQYEYYISNLVTVNSFWDLTIPSTVNAMLSIVMLVPIFSDIFGMSPIWVLKIIYPLLFSLVPLGLYRVFQKQTNDKIAFLACFFFVSVGTFYTEMLALARQQIAELFLVLLILLIIDKDMNKVNRSILLIMFGISLIVSHYGLSYIYLAVLIFAWALLVLFETTDMQKLVSAFYLKFNVYTNGKTVGNPTPTKITNRSISITYVLLFIVFTLTWYMYISSSSSFNTIVRIGDQIASSIFTDFLNPEAVQGLKLIMGETKNTLLSQLNRIINYLNQIFIIVGVLVLLLKHKKMKFEKEYTAFSAITLVILFAGVSVPFFASSLNMTRLYQITLIVLALFGVMGGIKILMVLSTIVRAPWTNRIVRSTLKILSIYFVIFFLYQVGFVYGVVEGNFYSISLSSTYNYPRFNDQEVLGAKWVYNVKDSGFIYADAYRWLLLASFEWEQAGSFSVGADYRVTVPADSYIYLGTRNVVEH